MTPPSSDHGDGSDSCPVDTGPGADAADPSPTVLLAAAALVCGLLVGWALTGAGFAVVEALLVGGVAALAVFSGLRYLTTRLSA